MLDKKKIFAIGAEKAKRDLSYTNILQTLFKLKAAVTMLVGDREDMIYEIERIYFEQSTISLDQE